MNKNKTLAYLAWVSICIVWGTTFLAIKIGVGSLPPMLFAGIRWIIAGPLFLSFLLLRGFKLPKLNEIKHIALVGILLIGVSNGLLVVAEQWIPSGLASLLIATMPFWIVGFELFIPNSYRFNKIIILGLLIGFSGILMIFWNELENLLDPSFSLGILAILGAVTSWSLGSLYSKYKKVNSHPFINAAIQMIIAGSFQISIGLILGEFNNFVLDLNSGFVILYLVIFGSLLGYAAYIYALSHLPVSIVTTYAYINPIIALFLGWFVLDEKISFTMIIAVVIIFCGVGFVQYGNLKNNILPLEKK